MLFGYEREDLDTSAYDEDENDVFGADEDELLSELDSIEAEADSDSDSDKYGGDYEWYGADIEKIQRAVLGAMPLVGGIAKAADRFWPDWLSLLDAEAGDVAKHIADKASSVEWASLTADQKRDIIGNAIGEATFGMPVESLKTVPKAISSIREAKGIVATVNAASGGWLDVARSFWTRDVPMFFKSVVVPGALSDEQMVNSWAIYLWGLDKTGVDVYRPIVEAIDESGALLPSEVVMPWPEQAIAPSLGGFRWPRPETILAAGYATLAAGAVFGIFK